MAEAGFTWLPPFMWRSDKIWRGVRREVPWVKEAPSELIKRQVRFTLQPVDAPENNPEPLARVLDQIGSDEMLLFATDFPHWHFDGTDAFPQDFPPALKKKIQADNPLATYARLRAAARPKEKETA
jgi:predicted TIM-barrel fold metal-dependent hydrolase